MESTVTCFLCKHSAETLARHLKSVHGVSADSYRQQFPGARIRSEQCEANRRAAITKAHERQPTKGATKLATCACGESHEVSRFDRKNSSCPECQAREKAKQWEGKSEPEDYVSCVGCGVKAENLTSHVQNSHPEWIGSYPGVMVALNSGVRDKTTLRGRILPEETRARMSENAGRWNKGHTKATHPSVAAISEHRMGQPSWSKGLTKAEHPSLQRTSDKLTRWSGPSRYWSNGLKADLSTVDFTPYLDETGAVDRRTMSEELHVSEETITKYMGLAGLRLSTKYVDESAERRTVRFEKDDLLKYTLGNGKVVIAQAMVGLGRDYKVIRRECDRHGLPTFHHRVRQTLCLDAVSKALGVVPYQQEWESMAFVNPSSGRRFRFDGFFPTHDLIVEFHGYQHYVFPSVYIQRDELYFALQERDRIKENLIHGDPVLRYFLVREDEPYTDVSYLRGRLIDEGVLDPGK